MFIYYILTSGYNWFIDLLMGDNKEHTDKDVILKVIMLGVILI